MALDGTVISCMAWELNHALAGGKINKIAQPEKDELMLTIKNSRKQYRLLVSASASLPLVYLTDQNKTCISCAGGLALRSVRGNTNSSPRRC